MGIGHVDGSSRHLWRFYGFFCGFSFWIAKGPLQKLRAIDSLNRQNQACIEGSTTLEALDRCHRQSRQAMHALRESFHRQISQLRDSYGLPKPNEPQQHRHGQANQS
jgi:hypothetical protein